MLRTIITIVASVFCLIIAYPQMQVSVLAWIAFVPLLLIIDQKSLRSAFGWSYAYGFLFFAGTLGWFVYVTYPGAMVLIAYLSLYFGLFGLGIQYFKPLPLKARILIYPSLWVVLEFIRAHFISGFGWVLLGHSQYQNLLLIQIADITGVYGISFLVMLVNVLIFESLKVKAQEVRRIQFIVLAILFLVLGYGLWRVQSFKFPPTVAVGVVQPNIQQDIKWDERLQPWIVQKTIMISQKLNGRHLDLIVWPETSLPGLVSETPYLMGAIKIAARQTHTAYLIGAINDEKGHYYNSAYLISGHGEIASHYDKIHLVPFGEYMPLRPILGWINNFVGLEDFTAGEKYTLMSAGLEQWPFGVLICFEDTAPDVRRNFVNAGATFLVNMTNDAWFKDTKAPFLHMQAAVFGSVEHKRSLVRAANTGFSGFIDPLGRILGSVHDEHGKQTFVEGVSYVQVPIMTQKTIYTKFGDVFTYLCLLVILGGIIVARRPIGEQDMSKKILIVDDDPTVHMITAPLLTKAGFTVVSAKSGEQGFQLALSERPHLIILDVIMPGIKGRDLCVKMKTYEVLKNIPVIFLTAKNSPEDLQAELAAGGVTHLTKPIEPENLIRAVTSAIG